MTSRRALPQPSNRRLRGANPRNQQLLDVKIRSSTARRQRRARFWGVAFFVLFWGGLLAGCYFSVSTLLDKFFFKNPAYTIRCVHLELDGALTPEEVASATNIREGTNIFVVDLEAARTKLESIPRVAGASIERELPDTVTVRIRARVPVAWIAPEDPSLDPFSPATSRLVDASGVVMSPGRLHPEFLGLPVLYGLKGDPPSQDALLPALELIAAHAADPASLLRIRSIDLSRGYRLDVTDDRNARIIFASEDFPEQLDRLQKLLAHCRESHRELQSVNLMVRRNTPVTFLADASTASTASNKPAARKEN